MYIGELFFSVNIVIFIYIEICSWKVFVALVVGKTLKSREKKTPQKPQMWRMNCHMKMKRIFIFIFLYYIYAVIWWEGGAVWWWILLSPCAVVACGLRTVLKTCLSSMQRSFQNLPLFVTVEWAVEARLLLDQCDVLTVLEVRLLWPTYL